MVKRLMFAAAVTILVAGQARAQSNFGTMPPAQTGQPAQMPYIQAPTPGTAAVQNPTVMAPPVTAQPQMLQPDMQQLPGYTPPGLPVPQGGLNAPMGGTPSPSMAK
jgi:hypothetical protein